LTSDRDGINDLGMSDDLPGRRTRIEHERMTKLLFPIADGDDALAFAIPLQVIDLPRDDFELPLESLIFAHDVPNANSARSVG